MGWTLTSTLEEKEDHVDPGVPVRSVPEVATFPRLLMSVHVRTRLVNVLVIEGRRAAASVLELTELGVEGDGCGDMLPRPPV